ncbi:MAG: alpha/beta hydrolase [Gemmatimonadetes bacterium]|nr:alpha/beta hydrolase [Gemmatimonadota bacterium]
MTTFKRWGKRLGLGALALLAAAIVIGAGYEARMRRQAAANHPAPGQLVDIGGRRIHLDCRGSGLPIVVLEAGLDMNGSLAWAKVHDSIAVTTRTCAYSRAGMMWSDDNPNQQDATTVAADLHAVLTTAGEKPPYVMVGHSLGGPYIMTFTKLHPAEVAGLVFVDASHPEQFQRFNDVLGRKLEPPVGPLRAAAAFAWAGVVRVAMPGAAAADSVGQAKAAYAPTSIGPMLEEMDALESSMAQAGTFRELGNRPLVVLTAMAPTDTNQLKALKMSQEESVRFQAAWKTMHEEEASWSTQSEHVLVPDATHYIQYDRPDIVIAAVRRVVGLVQNPVPAPPVH